MRMEIRVLPMQVHLMEPERRIEFVGHHQLLFFFFDSLDLVWSEDIEATPFAYHWRSISPIDSKNMYGEC